MLELSWPICYYKMAKKKQGINKTWVIAIVVIVALFFASNQGWFEKFSVSNEEIPQNTQALTVNTNSGSTSPVDSYVNLSITPGEPCLGQSVTGYISGNVPSAVCYLQAKIGVFPWMNIGDSFILDQQGEYYATTVAEYVGTAIFKVNCGAVVSNERIITVSAC